jgi:hypothetical protein
MNRAVETAANVYGPDSDELRRQRKSKMGVDQVWLSRYYPLRCEARETKQPFLGPNDPLRAAEEFAQLCQRFKTKAAVISQEGRFGQYLEGMKAGFLAQKNPPEICRGVPEEARVVFDAEDATEAAVRAFQWSCDKQAGIEAESPLEHLRETQEGGWQLDGKIRVSERGFGRDDALVLHTLDVVATWLGSLFPWVG